MPKTCKVFLPQATSWGGGTLAMELYPQAPGEILNGDGGDELAAVDGQPGVYQFTVAEEIATICRALLTLDEEVISVGDDLIDMSQESPYVGNATLSGGGSGDITIQNNIVVPAVVASQSQVANLLAAVRGDTLRRTFEDLGDFTNRSKLWLTVKRSTKDQDAAAILQVEETAGLLVFKGAAAEDSTLASLQVATPANAAVTLFVSEELLAEIESARGCVWDLQIKDASTGDVSTVLSGEFSLTEDVTRATE